MITPTLQTERLTLRPLALADANEVYSGWTHSEEIAKFMRWSVHKSVADTEEWLSAEEKAIDNDNYLWGIAHKGTGELLGSGSVIYSEAHGCYELGYVIKKSAHNCGYATEFSKRALKFLKEQLNQKSVFCCHALQNKKSESVIKKLGFKYVGDSKYSSFDGQKVYTCKDYTLQL